MDKNEFTLISPIFVANSILKISNEKNIKITPTKLNNLIYLVYLDFLYHTHTKLFNEEFSYTCKGPILPSIYYKFNVYEDEVIKKYAKDAKSQIFIIDDKIVTAIIDLNLELYANVSEEEIIEMTKQRAVLRHNVYDDSKIQKRYKENKKSYGLQLTKHK